MSADPRSTARRLLKPIRGVRLPDFAEIWRFRELLYLLCLRHVLVRYKPAILGVAWAVIQPVLTLAIFVILFGRIANFPSDGVPYSLMVLCGLVPWQFFASSITESSNSLLVAQNLVRKVYFPRLLIPISATASACVEFGISALLLVGLLVWHQQVPGPGIVFLPLFVLLAFLSALAAGIWLSAASVRFRDIKHLVPFFVRIGFFATPVAFLTRLVPEEYRYWMALNPMVAVIDGFRWALLGSRFEPWWPGVWVACTTVPLLLAGGLIVFRNAEKEFADLI